MYMKFHLLDIEFKPDRGWIGKSYDYINLTIFQFEDANEYPITLFSIGWWGGKFYLDILFSDLIQRKIGEWKDEYICR